MNRADGEAALRALRIEAAWHFLFGVGLAGAAALASGPLVAEPPAYAVQAAVALAAMSLALFPYLSAHLPLRRFGPANRVTLIRAVLVALLAGLLGRAGIVEQGLGWPIFVLALAAVLLDGADGWVARRRGCGSAFGARFDQELDAVAILVLALLAAELGKAGPWIVVAGLLRYLFLGAQLLFPRLARPLPPSRRRSAVCAAQSIALVACLAPVLAPPASGIVAGAGLALLTVSFVLDLWWLANPERRYHGTQASA